MKRIYCMALLLGMTVAMWGEDKPTTLANARAAIEANMQTPQGKAYDEKFGAEVMDRYIGGMRQCQRSAGGNSESFWLLVKLQPDGSAREVLLAPATKVGNCDREILLKGKFSPPPHGDYWQGMYLKMSH